MRARSSPRDSRADAHVPLYEGLEDVDAFLGAAPVAFLGGMVMGWGGWIED